MNSSHPAFEARVPRILVVDDTPDNLFLMSGLFEDRYEVQQAASGAEALLAVMSDNPPDMVLLDIMMPEMDGYEVLRRIRQHPPTANVPVIFLTALSGAQEERLGLTLGAVDYLTKPIDPEQVIRRVDEQVRATIHSRRMEALSERLSRHLAPLAWRALFHGDDTSSISFQRKQLTLLYVDSGTPTSGNRQDYANFMAEVKWLADKHGGTVDAFGWDGVMVFFEHAGPSVRMAMDLQRNAADLHLRMGIHTGACDVASFSSQGSYKQTLVGADTGLAARVANSAASGSIVITPEAYSLVQEAVNADMKGCVLTEEFQDSDLAQASLTPFLGDRSNGFSRSTGF